MSLSGEGEGQSQSLVSPPALSNPLTAWFDHQEIKASVEPEVEVVEFSYEFTNTGELPLAVEEFSHSSGCMVGEWDGVPIALIIQHKTALNLIGHRGEAQNIGLLRRCSQGSLVLAQPGEPAVRARQDRLASKSQLVLVPY